MCDWERYAHNQVPRPLGKEVVGALRTKALGDQIDGLQAMIGLLPRPSHARGCALYSDHDASGTRRQEMGANLGGTLGARFPVPTGGEVWRFAHLCLNHQKLPSAVQPELWLALFLPPLPRTELRVPVEPQSSLATPACQAEPKAGRQISQHSNFSPPKLPHVKSGRDKSASKPPTCTVSDFDCGRTRRLSQNDKRPLRRAASRVSSVSQHLASDALCGHTPAEYAARVPKAHF